MERSIAGQVEFWARLGKAVEGLLTGQQMMVMGREENSQALLNRLDTVDTVAGRKRVKDFLASEPYPHYNPHPDNKDLLIRTEENGKRTAGRFINREFVVVKTARKKKAA